jgi:hypothetical protein
MNAVWRCRRHPATPLTHRNLLFKSTPNVFATSRSADRARTTARIIQCRGAERSVWCVITSDLPRRQLGPRHLYRMRAG